MDPRFEAVYSDEDSSFRCLRFRCQSFAQDHTWHYHPEYELTWIIRSTGTRFVGDSIQPYSSGDLVLLGPELPHCWNDAQGDGCATPELIVVQFRADCLGAGFLDLKEARPVRDLLLRARSGVAFEPAVSSRIETLLSDLAEQRGLRRLTLFLALLEALTDARDGQLLASQSYQTRNDIDLLNRHRMETVHRYIRQNLAENICQSEIAAQLRMSSSSFSRFFRAATGRTFVGFVNALRVNEACRRLSDSSRSVTEIAMECGYHNISNFNRQFLILKGMNPGRYRQHIRERTDRDRQWRDGVSQEVSSSLAR